MRAIYAITGAFFVIIGGIAAVTGEAAMHGAWAVAIALAALGITGLVAAATSLSN